MLLYDDATDKWQNEALPAHAHAVEDIAGLLAELQKTDAVVFHDGSTYPLRSTVTGDVQRRVRWVGPDAPTIGSGYAVDGLDIWERTE